MSEEDSTACKGIILRHGVGQLKHLATRTMWAQQILLQEGIEVRRISRAVNSADRFASHNSSQDLYRAVDQIGGVWLGAQLAWSVTWSAAGMFLATNSFVLNEMSLRYPPLKVPIPASLQGTQVPRNGG